MDRLYQRTRSYSGLGPGRGMLLAAMVVAALALGAGRAVGFELTGYAEQSRLSTGRWVKIKVAESGMYLITPQQLRNWGFAEPSRVRVYGYGGAMQSDILREEEYNDDLPLAGCEYVEPQGLYFYAQGPVNWSYDGGGHFVPDQNYYSSDAYYFLSDAPEPAEIGRTGAAERAADAAERFTGYMVHEQELVSAGATGHILLGEDFRTRTSQTFTFDLAGNAGSSVWIQTSFASYTLWGVCTLGYTVNGAAVEPSPSTIESPASDSARHFLLQSMSATADLGDDASKLALGITYTPKGTVVLARLDNIVVNYSRSLTLDGAQLPFNANGGFALGGAKESTRVWDVTTPGAVMSVATTLDAGKACATPTLPGMRKYVAWTPEATLPAPTYVGVVANQDLHAREAPDMLIITLSQWATYAEQIADVHRAAPQNLDVLVVTAEQAYNEFSSGTPDFGAFRRLAKMYWDRGGGSMGSDSKLRYILMFGRAFHDHRAITDEGKGYNGLILPQWQSVDGATDNQSYTTEDYLAFLRDGSGAAPGSDYHCVGVGRIPLGNSGEARIAVEKIKNYMLDSRKGDWKNRYLLCADDGDSGEHLLQMEQADSLLMVCGRGHDNVYHKVYVDAFNVINSKAPDAHERMFRYLDQGCVWWWYTGHASSTAWTGEGLLEFSDVNTASFTHPPMLFAATCNFLRWDRLQLSGAEIMFFNTNGIIGAIAATRPVYIAYNKTMTNGLARTANLRDDAGRSLPLGEVFRRAKNTSLGNDTNKLRYVLMGDPALPLALPEGNAVLDAVGDDPLDPDNPPTIMAQQRLTISGRVLDQEGNTDTSFDGYVVPTIYDSEYSTTSLGRSAKTSTGVIAEGVHITFEEMGERLFVGRGNVSAGEFTVNVAMPMEIAGNYRPATLNLYAVSSDGSRDAGGVNRQFYVYGYADDVEADTIPPVIDYFGLNTETFRSGQSVNATPMVIAHVSDDIGINISAAGIGHQISLQLDGNQSFPEAVYYYSPGAEGAAAGNLYYSMPELTTGSHTLRLRVWDTSNNMAEASIDFYVDPTQPMQIIDLYADCNPAMDHTNFIVSHNRPDANLTVTVEVFDLMGRRVWTGEQSARSELGLSSPLSWDLTDQAGRRVPRGIYVYRGTATADNQTYVSASRKLAVAAIP